MASPVTNLFDSISSASETLKKEGLTIVGKQVVQQTPAFTSGVGSISSGVSAANATGIGGGAAAGTGSVLGIFGIGAAAAVSAVIEQIEYRDNRNKLREFYRDEIAAKLGKSIHQVVDKDLDILARGDARRGIAPNYTLASHLAEKRKERNYGILTSAISMLATITLVHVAMAASAGVLLHIALGMACFKLVEAPLEWVGKHIFGVGRETTHDKIMHLSKDFRHCKSVSREQVLGVFVSADRELQRFVEANYGEAYDQLDRDAKEHVADTLEQFIPLKKITENIINGTIQPNELAFTVQGDFSGVLPHAKRQKHGLLGKAGEVIKTIGHSLGMGHHEKPVIHSAPVEPVRPQRAVVEYDNETSSRSFADKILAERAQLQQHTIH